MKLISTYGLSDHWQRSSQKRIYYARIRSQSGNVETYRAGQKRTELEGMRETTHQRTALRGERLHSGYKSEGGGTDPESNRSSSCQTAKNHLIETGTAKEQKGTVSNRADEGRRNRGPG